MYHLDGGMRDVMHPCPDIPGIDRRWYARMLSPSEYYVLTATMNMMCRKWGREWIRV